jgi:YD repeat-containing protein
MNSIRVPRRRQSADRLVSRLRLRTFSATVTFALVALAIGLYAPEKSYAQGDCIYSGSSGGESLSAQVTIDDGSGAQVTDGMVVPTGIKLRFDAVTTAFGECRLICDGGVLSTWNRTINHIHIYADISTSGSLNGRYSVGNVFGKNPNGTTAMLNVLDTRAADSSGPLYMTLSNPGTYQFEIQANINITNCALNPDKTDMIVVTVTVREKDDDPNNGPVSCNSNVGEPVNVTNGNMYLQQTDYRLPGAGGGLDFTRTNNSNSKRVGLFGYGWATFLDESINAYGAQALRLNLPDGRSVLFTRGTTAEPFTPKEPPDFRGQITRNGDGSHSLTFKDGGVHQFNASGKLVSLADRNNNLTTVSYDANGRPATITDPAGRAVTLVLNSSGRVLTLSDQMGVVATYTYGGGGTLSTVTYADNSQFKFTYGVTQNRYVLTVVKDALNNIVESHAYDAQGRATVSEQHGGVEKYTLAYVGAAETHVTDALGHVTKYFFDKSRGRNVVTRVEGSCGCGGSRVETWAYDAQLNVTARTNALNQTTAYTYDAAGNRLTESGPLGTTTYTYNGFGQVLTATDPLNGVTTSTYDAAGNLLTIKDALDQTTTFTYTARGQLASVTDPRTNKTEFTYDAAGNLTERKDAALNTTTFAYDARGRLTSTTDALNQTTDYEYDAAGRIRKVTRPDSAFVTFTYDLAGRRTKVKDARNNETTYEYDGAYRLTKRTDAATKTTLYGYDLASNLVSETDELGRVTNYEHDDFNRLVKTIYPEATTGAGRLYETIEYDAAGNVTKRTDTAGRATLFEYDTANRLRKVTDAAQQVTQYEYNARSEMTAVVDALGQRYEFVYDAAGRATQVKRAGLQMTFAYDAAGNRVERRDYSGALTTYSYDALNRLTSIAYPDTTAAVYGYDALSRLTTATNQHGTVTMSYDSVGRVSGTTDVYGRAVGYGYDANDNRTELRLGGTVKATYQYDALNRLTQMADGGAFTFAYDATSKIVSRAMPNGVTSTYEYDGLDRLTRLKHAKGAATVADY